MLFPCLTHEFLRVFSAKEEIRLGTHYDKPLQQNILQTNECFYD